jgi:hypothetical protein
VSNLCLLDSAAKMTKPTPLISTPEASPNLMEPRTSESIGHVMGGAGVEAPPVSLVDAGAVAEEGVCSRLIKVEESRYDRCRWR